MECFLSHRFAWVMKAPCTRDYWRSCRRAAARGLQRRRAEGIGAVRDDTQPIVEGLEQAGTTGALNVGKNAFTLDGRPRDTERVENPTHVARPRGTK